MPTAIILMSVHTPNNYRNTYYYYIQNCELFTHRYTHIPGFYL